MNYDFSGRKALVTGGARGIGKEIVRRLVGSKAEVIALDLNEENLDKLKDEIPSVRTICVDLADWAAARRAVKELGVIDLLVNNAGIIRQGGLEDITEEDFDSFYAVMVKPVVNISQVFVKALKKQGKQGAIVNTSSLASTKYLESIVAYSACKATIDKLTKTMAVELATFGIRVNAVNPTVVLTELVSSHSEGKIEKLRNKIPLKRCAEVKDVASAVLFLLSDEAKMITGTCLRVDGGHGVA